MARTRLYFGVKKVPAMPANAWDSLINKIENNMPGTNDLRENTFQIRYNLNTPFDAAIYEANFLDTDITAEKIRQLLVQAFNLADNRVTFALSSQTFLILPSPVATYKLDGTNMFRATIFGGYSATPTQSNLECQAYIHLNDLEWNGVNG